MRSGPFTTHWGCGCAHMSREAEGELRHRVHYDRLQSVRARRRRAFLQYLAKVLHVSSLHWPIRSPVHIPKIFGNSRKKKERDLGRIRDAPVGEGALRGVVRQSLFGRFEEAAVYEESGDHLRMIRAEIFASIFLSTSTNSSLLTLAN